VTGDAWRPGRSEQSSLAFYRKSVVRPGDPRRCFEQLVIGSFERCLQEFSYTTIGIVA